MLYTRSTIKSYWCQYPVSIEVCTQACRSVYLSLTFSYIGLRSVSTVLWLWGFAIKVRSIKKYCLVSAFRVVQRRCCLWAFAIALPSADIASSFQLACSNPSIWSRSRLLSRLKSTTASSSRCIVSCCASNRLLLSVSWASKRSLASVRSLHLNTASFQICRRVSSQSFCASVRSTSKRCLASALSPRRSRTCPSVWAIAFGLCK